MATENVKTGGIQVQTQHIFPVIKRWLYSDKEIFLREIVSNACDAVTKFKRLVSLGQAREDGDYRITVRLDEAAGTLTVSDNGIGMSADEVEKYICQIALSGALEFIEKYEGDQSAGGIIGHFGLGFYSAFMVADRVDVNTQSFVSDTPAVAWTCTENGEYSMQNGSKQGRGTDVVLHVTQEEKEFLNPQRIEGLLKKYCAFLPVEVYLEVAGQEPPTQSVNDTTPLWLKSPSECTPQEYSEFYHTLFADPNDPLFYVHINADFPLNFKGILYFPKLTHEYANLEGQVKLYYNQVFVADNIKEVIPEYLMLLKGVLDCPELPLNVSRSYLQNSGYVAKVSAHIVKKVCDKLKGLFENDRAAYEGFWGDIKPFVEYGCMRDPKFGERAGSLVLLPIAGGGCLTLEEYLEKGKGTAWENKVYYTSDPVRQASYLSLFSQQNVPVAVMDAFIDNQFIQYTEANREGKVQFVRIDSDVDELLKDAGEVGEHSALKALFEEVCPQGTAVSFERLKNQDLPTVITHSEQQRRFEDMMKLYAGKSGQDLPKTQQETLLVNLSCPLVQKLEQALGAGEDLQRCRELAKHLRMLGVIAQRPLDAQELGDFIRDTVSLLSRIG